MEFIRRVSAVDGNGVGPFHRFAIVAGIRVGNPGAEISVPFETITRGGIAINGSRHVKTCRQSYKNVWDEKWERLRSYRREWHL